MWRRVLRAASSQLERCAAANATAGGASTSNVAATTATAAEAATAPHPAAFLGHRPADLLAQFTAANSVSGATAHQMAAATAALQQLRGYATRTQVRAAANPGLKYWNPTSPGQRGRVTVRRLGIWRGGPKRRLTHGVAKTGGRNHHGRITVWHRGGGARKVLRDVDFQRRPETGGAVVERLEYDPGRSGYIALLRHDTGREAAELKALTDRAAGLRPAATLSTSSSSSSSSNSASSSNEPSTSSGSGDEYRAAVGELLDKLKTLRAKAARGGTPTARTFSYILAPQDLKPGDVVAAGANAPVRPGNTLQLRDIPVGMPIHNLEMRPGRGAVLCRSAGCLATIVTKQETHAIVRLPSGEQRLFPMTCHATIGAVSNPQHQNRVIGKAGYARHMGRRPVVRGVAMNPVDHPHGGKTSGGRPSVTPWGIPCKGFRTRRHTPMFRWILSRRGGNKAASGGPPPS